MIERKKKCTKRVSDRTGKWWVHWSAPLLLPLPTHYLITNYWWDAFFYSFVQQVMHWGWCIPLFLLLYITSKDNHSNGAAMSVHRGPPVYKMPAQLLMTPEPLNQLSLIVPLDKGSGCNRQKVILKNAIAVGEREVDLRKRQQQQVSESVCHWTRYKSTEIEMFWKWQCIPLLSLPPQEVYSLSR